MEWLEGIHTAFEKSIAWRMFTGTVLHLRKGSVVGRQAFGHTTGIISL